MTILYEDGAYTINGRVLCGIYAGELKQHPGKYYIGYSKHIKDRISKHKKDYTSKNWKFYNAIRKYGWNNVRFYLVEECEAAKLTEKEIYYSDKYDSVSNGWNTVACGGYNPMDDATTRGQHSSRLQAYWAARREPEEWNESMRPLTHIVTQAMLRKRKQILNNIETTKKYKDIIQCWPEEFVWSDVMKKYDANKLKIYEGRNLIHPVGKRDGLILYRKGRKPHGYIREHMLMKPATTRIPADVLKAINKAVVAEYWTEERRKNYKASMKGYGEALRLAYTRYKEQQMI